VTGDPEILISRYFDDLESMTQQDLDQLSEWIKQDPSHARRFARAAFIHRAVHDCLVGDQIQGALETPASSATPDDSGFVWDDRFWHWIAEYERTAPALRVERPEPVERRPQKAQPLKGIKKANRILLFLGAFCLTLLLLLFAVAGLDRIWSHPVATLRSSMQAAWAGSASMESGARLASRKAPLRLLRGTVEIVFDSGAEMLVEAPAEFSLKSTRRVELQAGRLFAKVPEAARGFTVDTPYSRVVDLGTQFGVRVDPDRSSDLHVFKGRASLTPETGGRAGKTVFLAEDEAKQVTRDGAVRDIPLARTGFVRRINSRTGLTWRGEPVNLADVVGGGNGFGTGQLGRWLEITTGMDGTRYIVNGQTTQQCQITDNRYHHVMHLPYVDGVFSPDGGAGPVQVSSQKHLWPDCPKTSGRYFEDVFNGDFIPAGAKGHGSVLNGQAFGTREHPAIALHSNAGITFDLDTMRRDIPGLEIIEFKATCGISEDVRRHLDGTEKGIADFWVLVDGKKRFEAIGIDVNSSPLEISVPLGRRERFVTLVTTDGDGRPNYDWCLFAEPRLEVRAIQTRRPLSIGQ